MVVNKYRREDECEAVFRRMGTVFNANTPENHPVVFSTDEQFKAGMSILAICAKMFADVRIYAFQLMSNHIHLVVGGDRLTVQEFFAYYAGRLDKYFEGRNDKCVGGRKDFSGFKLKLFPVSDLSYLRNAVVYVNRNGFVVNNDVTPFSYPWGSSPYFFQPIAVRYVGVAGKTIGVIQLRSLMHTRSCDRQKDLKLVDGYISPLEFCDIVTAESIFRDAKQYFYLISRKIEAYSDVAKSIGESIYYNDNDLYTAAVKLSIEQYGTRDPRTLPSAAKLELAKRLHYDYNAGGKQLQRLVSIDAELLKAIF